MDRNVFIFIDGTMCSGDTGTNVVVIQEAVSKGAKVEWDYAEGIAATSSWKFLQTILPTEINNEASRAYKILCALKVTADDRLIIIGYSRGAIVARILAQMITNDVARRDVWGSSERGRQILPRTTVDFLGLFDPVRGRPYPANWISGYDADAHNNSSILNLLEIVSIDEGFVFFRSDSVVARHNKPPKDNKVLKFLSKRPVTKAEVVGANRQMTLETSRHFCLFPGVHGDIGGQDANVALGSASALTMVAEIIRLFPDISDNFRQQSLDRLRASLTNHPRIIIGDGYRSVTGILKRAFRLSRRFHPNGHTTVHPLVDELVGEKGVTKAWKFSRFRRYKIPPEVDQCTRTVLTDF